MARSSSLRSSEVILREIQVNLLECKVCFEKFNTQQKECRPQNLSCGHVLCQECISALAHPLLKKLECPFCRQMCSTNSTSHSQVLSDLQELLSSFSPASSKRGFSLDTGLTSTSLHFCTAFGRWGTLINPNGIAVLGSSGTVVVVHDGKRRVVVFSSQGKKLHSFGVRGRANCEICYPVDVAVTPCGHVVVTDAGDQAVKVFTSRGNHVLTVRESFLMPWGVDTNSYGHILVSDTQAGILYHININYSQGLIDEQQPVVKDLKNPKAVACCPVTENTAVLEYLPDEKYPPKIHQHTRLRVYSKDFHILYQTDSFSLTLQFTVKINISGLTFDRNGDIIIVDSNQGMIWSLGKVQKSPILTPLVGDQLVRPTGLVTMRNTLLILDSGDHTVKIYSTKSDA